MSFSDMYDRFEDMHDRMRGCKGYGRHMDAYDEVIADSTAWMKLVGENTRLTKEDTRKANQHFKTLLKYERIYHDAE